MTVREALLVALLAAGCAHPAGPRAPPATASPPAAPPAAAAPAPDLGRVRAGADAVLRAQAEGYWRTFTEGERLDPALAWRGHEALLSDGTLREVAAAAAAPGEAGLGAAYLRSWLLGERLARDGAGALASVARARAEAAFPWGERRVPLAGAAALLAAERAPARRREIAEAAAAAAGPLVPLVEAREARLRELAGALGYASPLALAAALRGEPPAALGALAEATLAQTDRTWRALLAELARREGLAPADVRARDLPRLLRGVAPPRALPASRMIDAGASVLAGLGLDLVTQPNLRLDALARPGKLGHAIALPIDPPGDVRLSCSPEAGIEAARGLLHELGAAEYYAHASAGPVELRRLGPGAVAQSWALLLEEVAGAPEWLAERGVDEERARAEARAAAARRLYRAREAAGRVLSALARAEAPAAPPGQDARLLARVLGVPAEEGDLVAWRAEADPLLRAVEPLRAELLAAQLEVFLIRKAGAAAWWRSRAAGEWLVATWAEGSRRTVEERVRSLGEERLDARALDAVVRARARL